MLGTSDMMDRRMTHNDGTKFVITMATKRNTTRFDLLLVLLICDDACIVMIIDEHVNSIMINMIIFAQVKNIEKYFDREFPTRMHNELATECDSIVVSNVEIEINTHDAINANNV